VVVMMMSTASSLLSLFNLLRGEMHTTAQQQPHIVIEDFFVVKMTKTKNQNQKLIP
jgi:hypothetical protein